MDAAWIGIIGVLGAAIVALFGNISNNRSALKKEQEIGRREEIKRREEREWENRKKDEERAIERHAQTFKIYNDFLNEDGNYQYVTLTEDLDFKDFDKDRYKQSIRPILLSGLHLLSNEVFKLVRKLDGFTHDDLHFTDPKEWNDDMAGVYLKLVEAIEKEYEKRI